MSDKKKVMEGLISIRSEAKDKMPSYRQQGWEIFRGILQQAGYEDEIQEFEEHVRWGN